MAVVLVQTLPSSKSAERSKLSLSNGTSFEVEGLAPAVAERLAAHDSE